MGTICVGRPRRRGGNERCAVCHKHQFKYLCSRGKKSDINKAVAMSRSVTFRRVCLNTVAVAKK